MVFEIRELPFDDDRQACDLCDGRRPVIVWAITGPFFHYSDTWQLVINTSTTIVTFLMVFLIQNTQNRDTAAMQTTRRASSQPREVMDWLRPPRSGEVRPIVLGDRNGK
jgi:hypothetical protein